MKINVGNKLSEIVDQSGFRKKHIADKMGITVQWLTKVLKADEVDEETISKIGEIIRYDFKRDFKKMNTRITVPGDIESKLNQLIDVNAELVKLITKQNEFTQKLLLKLK